MTTEPIFRSDRFFQAWRYTVSHGQLLIQSQKTDLVATRLEILFKDVEYMAVRPVMHGLSIAPCSRDRLPDFLAGLAVTGAWYELRCDKGKGYIACGAVAFSEDALGHGHPSALMDDFGL